MEYAADNFLLGCKCQIYIQYTVEVDLRAVESANLLLKFEHNVVKLPELRHYCIAFGFRRCIQRVVFKLLVSELRHCIAKCRVTT